MAASLKNFSASGEDLSPYCFKKLKMEFQFIAGIVAKPIMIKAGTFDRLTKETFQVMTTITSGIHVNYASGFFKTISEMVQKWSSTDFVVHKSTSFSKMQDSVPLLNMMEQLTQ